MGDRRLIPVALVVVALAAAGAVVATGRSGRTGSPTATRPYRTGSSTLGHTTTPPPVTVSPVVLLHDRDFVGPVAAYRALTSRGLDDLVARTDVLADAARRGDWAAARTAWLAAHQAYGRLGAAYDAFGAADAAIDGRPDGLPGGKGDPAFSGFLRIEGALWAAPSRTTVEPWTDRLDRDVHQLQQAFPADRIDARDLPLRAHEILENALQFELTQATDEGSGTGLAMTRAAVDATRIVISALRTLINARDPRLGRRVDRALDDLASRLDRHRHGDGSWDRLDQLDQLDREHLDAATSGAVELLALLPGLLPLSQT